MHTSIILVKKILALYYLYNILFLDSMSIPVSLAMLQEYFNIFTSLAF